MVQVSKAEVDQLATETMMLKEFLPKLLTQDLLTSISRLTQRDQGPLQTPHTSLTHPLTHEFTHSLTHSLMNSLAHSLTHTLTHSLPHSHTHSLTHSLTEVWALRREKETADKELEHLRRRTESLKAEFEQEKQVFYNFQHLHCFSVHIFTIQEKFAVKVSFLRVVKSLCFY